LIGTLFTFIQFIFVATTGYVSQFDLSRPPLFLKPNRVPIRRWLINIMLFFTINVLNNHAFSYNISVPIHIILRSGGSITTIMAGYLFGKRYSRLQVISVILLTIGVIIAAWSDAQAKVRPIMYYFLVTTNTCRITPRTQTKDSLLSVWVFSFSSSHRSCRR
jgi:solute carrier family 35 (UDP-xylose/UDP-N-acetylglucosamine transporter), member B4